MSLMRLSSLEYAVFPVSLIFLNMLVRVRVFVSNPSACSGEQYFQLYYFWSIGFVVEDKLSNDTMTDVRLPNSVNQPIYLT